MSGFKGFGKIMKPTASFKTRLNVGGMFDIPTGEYLKGKDGHWYLNGGVHSTILIGGRGNTYKSTIAHWLMLSVLNNYKTSSANQYDTEISISLDRICSLAYKLESIRDADLYGQLNESEARIIYQSAKDIWGDEWFDQLKEYVEAKKKEKKSVSGKLPFLDKNGNYYEDFYPDVFEVDSLSEWQTKKIFEQRDKHSIGDSKMNTDNMGSAGDKSRMIGIMTPMLPSAGIYGLFTGHMGNEIKMDPYAPSTKQLQFLKNGLKFKNIPEKASFNMSVTWITTKVEALIRSGTKDPVYPINKEDNVPGQADLQMVTFQTLRNKGGLTAYEMNLIVSQSKGYLPSLSQFHYCKDNGRFGLTGNDRSYAFDFMPEIKLERTTVFGKLEDSYELRRAAEFTAELLQIYYLFANQPGFEYPKLLPAEIYEILKGKGYDWNELLKTRGYWVFQEHENLEERNYLSTKDLLQMACTDWVPPWYKKEK